MKLCISPLPLKKIFLLHLTTLRNSFCDFARNFRLDLIALPAALSLSVQVVLQPAPVASPGSLLIVHFSIHWLILCSSAAWCLLVLRFLLLSSIWTILCQQMLLQLTIFMMALHLLRLPLLILVNFSCFK